MSFSTKQIEENQGKLQSLISSIIPCKQRGKNAKSKSVELGTTVH